MTTIQEVRTEAWAYCERESLAANKRVRRDDTIRRCYSAGNATLGQLAQATGLSPQRVHQIVREES